jgi:hypothetical protein
VRLIVCDIARERHLDNKTMINFILLSQILPISFTVSLFIMQLHLTAQDVQPTSLPNASPTYSATAEPRVSPHIPNVILNVLLLAQPFLRHKPVFSTLLFLERGILLLPHTGLLSLKNGNVVRCAAITGAFMATSLWVARQDLEVGNVLRVLGGGLDEGEGGYAVKALGWDAVLGAVVYGVLVWNGGV